jgi:hypothetical protein
VERIVLVARLKPESRDRAQDLIAQAAASEKVAPEFERAGSSCGGELDARGRTRVESPCAALSKECRDRRA